MPIEESDETHKRILHELIDDLQSRINKLIDQLDAYDEADEIEERIKNLEKIKQSRKDKLVRLQPESIQLNELAAVESKRSESSGNTRFDFITHIQKTPVKIQNEIDSIENEIKKLEEKLKKIYTKKGGRKKTRKHNKNKHNKSRKRK
jgi:hypothetical protein